MTYEPETDWDDEAGEDSTILDVEMLREDLIGELQSINQYHEHIEMMEDEEAQELLRRIVSEEKEHVAELIKLVARLDPEQGEKFRQSGS